MKKTAGKNQVVSKEEISWRLNSQEREYFRRLEKNKLQLKEPQVLWGWKRDKVVDGKRFSESRTVYFSADLALRGEVLYLKRAYFFLETRARRKEIYSLGKKIGGSRAIDGYSMKMKVVRDELHRGYLRLRMEVGEASLYDQQTVARRLRGKPRMQIAPPRLISKSRNYDLRKYSPFVLYCGSGLSSESGLPFLSKIHDLFEVDDSGKGELIFGDKDRLPGRIVNEIESQFRKFCQFTVDALKAKPTSSYNILKKLYQKGIIQQVFTDNVDDILSKVNIPYTQTRLSIFPDRFPAKFDLKARALLVIGISVDRRDIIKQARRRGLKIIAINPIFNVAPYSRNMDYLSRGDILFKGKAQDILPKIVKESGF